MKAPYTYPPWLLKRQSFLLESLLARDRRLHDWYLGVLITLGDELHPDRVAFAGYGLRELSDELMTQSGVQASNFNLGQRINSLLGSWEKVEKDADDCAGVCAKHAGGRLRSFLARLGGVFRDQAEFHPTRQVQIRSAIADLDVNSRIAAGNEAQTAIDQWKRIHEFFNKCTHHGVISLDELRENLEVFEQLLTDLLLPSPSGDLAAIDEILAEEDANA